MPTAIVVYPLLPGKQEAWRRFFQKLREAHVEEHRAFCKRLGITKEQIWLLQTSQIDFAVFNLEVEVPQQALTYLTISEQPFERWLRRQLLELHSFDPTWIVPEASQELILEWQVT